MKQVINLSILFLLTFCFSSCDKSGTTITKDYDFSTITKVSVQSACDANISYGTTQKVEATGSEPVLDNLDMYVDGTTLIIKLKAGIFLDVDAVIDITIADLVFVEVKGSGDIFINDFSGLGDLTLDVSGSGNIGTGNLDLGQNKLTTYISGSGDVDVNGTAESTYTKVSGSGNYEAFGLAVNSANVDVSGSGDAEVNVNHDLEINISGSGDVSYKGQASLNTEVTGSGEVININ
jgi:hypothetical protein